MGILVDGEKGKLAPGDVKVILDGEYRNTASNQIYPHAFGLLEVGHQPVVSPSWDRSV